MTGHSWQDVAKQGDAAQVRRARKDQDSSAPRARIDRASTLMILAGVLALATIGGVAGLAIDRAGYFDPPLRRPLEDPRALNNFRDSGAPIVGSAALADGVGEIALLRADGALTLFDPVTGLLASDRVPTGLNSPPVALSAGCGLTQPSSEPCVEADTLHVLSREGGLAERSASGDWRVVLPDSGWTGVTGTLVQQAEVQSWAASRDGSRIAVVAGAQGMAVFDTHANRWLVPDRQDVLIAAGEVRLVPDGATFWLIGGQGLGRVTQRSGLPVLEWSPQRNFVVRDLSVSPSGETLAVVEGDCQVGPGPDCLYLATLAPPFTLTPLIGERARFPNLSAAGLAHAQLQGTVIVTLGAAGVHAYDSIRREWREVLEGRVDSFYAAERGVILATQGNTVLRVSNGQVASSRTALGGPFAQVLLAGNRALGLARDGALRDLDDDTVLLPGPADLPAAVSFTTGASLGSRVLLLGPDGALLHDAETRFYRWFPAASLAALPVLRQSGTRLYATETDFWAVGRDGTIARVVAARGATADLTLADAGQVPAPPRSATVSRTNLRVVDANGRPWQATARQQLVPIVGEPRVGGRGLPGMAAPWGNGLAFADAQDIWRYNQQTRAWGEPFAPPRGARVAGLAANDALFVVTEAGDVWRNGEQDWQPVVAGGQAAIDFGVLTDAATNRGALFLGGQGRVQRYDMDRSRFGPVWSGGSGAVRIVDLSGTQPVWLSANQLFRGSTALTERQVRGAWAVDDGILAEAVLPGGARHSLWFTQAGAQVCTRHGAPAPEGTLIDGLSLGSGRVLVATTGGVGLHDPASRRWLSVRGLRLRSGERLHRVGDGLVVVGPTGLRTLPLAQLQVPDSCADPVIVPQAATSYQARVAAFDESSGRVALLAADGAVTVWSDQGLQTVLSAATAGPRRDDILESAAEGQNYLAATAQAIWHYNTGSRVWSRAQIAMPQASGRIVDVALSDVSETGAAVTAWTAEGQSFSGEFRTGARNVQLVEMTVPAFPRIAMPADAIADVAIQGSDLAVTGAGRVEFGRSGDAAMTATLSLPDGLDPVPYRWAGLTAFRAAASGRGEVRYLLPRTALAGLEGALEALAFRYDATGDRGAGLHPNDLVLWRVDAAGAVLRCPIVAGQDEQRGCTEVVPAPPRMRAEDVIVAHRQADGHVIVANTGVSRVDQRYRRMQAIAGPVPRPDAALIQSDGLLLLEGAGGALWRLQDEQALQLAQAVQDLRLWQGHMILDAPGAALVPAADETLARLAGASPFVSFDWLGEQGFTLLDDQDRAVDGQGRVLLDLPLANRETILGVLPEPGGQGLWVHRANGTLDLVRRGTCERGPPHAPPVPCLRSALERPISDRALGRFIGVTRQTDESLLSFERGTLARPTRGGLRVDRVPPTRFRQLQRIGSADQIRRLIVSLPDGTAELAPPILGNSLVIAEETIANLAREPQPWAALSLGWIAWQREDRRFSVPTAGGNRLHLAAGDLLRDGRLVQTLPGRGLRISQGSERYSWLNQHGLWSIASPGAAPELIAQIETLPAIAVAGHRFLFDGPEGLDALTGQVSPDSNRLTIDFGDLRITDQPRERRVLARLRRSDGTEADGFGETGFVHDRRDGIGWRGQSLVIVTPAGIVPTGALREVDPEPDASAPQRIYTVAGAMLGVSENGAWQHYTGQGRWTPTPDPFANRTLAREDGVVWAISAASGLTLTPEIAGEDWRVARQGLNFHLDRLITLTGRAGQILFATPLGTHALSNAASLNRATPANEPGPVAAPFDAMSVADGTATLFDGGAAPRIWDGAWRSPAGPRETPWVSRQAVESPAIRLTFRQSAPPEALRRVTRISGGGDWAAFRWERGQAMPFDQARAIFATPEGLWIGTGFGLRWANSGGVTSDVLDIAAPASAGTAIGPVTRLGRPLDDPSIVLATGAGQSCAVLERLQSAGPCGAIASLDRQWIHADSLWHWEVVNDRLNGSYVIDGSPTLPVALTPNGYLTHDALLATMECGGGSSELWANGRILRTASLSTEVPEGQGQGLLCQRTPAELGGGQRLAAGAYLAGSQSYSIDASGVLQPLGNAGIAQAVVERVQGRIALDRRRLRITTGAFDGAYQYRSLDDQWAPLAFANNHPALDVTTDIRHGPAGIDRLTPAGVLRNAVGRVSLSIDPDAVTLGSLADRTAWEQCDPQHILRLDGDEHGIPSRLGAPALLRCANGSAVLETRPTADFGAFEPIPDDPSAATTLINRSPWRWTRRLTAGVPVLAIQFQDEPVDLAAGRFPMDDLVGVAQVDAGQVDLISAHGWWRHSIRSLGAEGARRDPRESAAAAVRDIRVALGAAGAAELCLELPERQVALSTPPRVVPACREWQGYDGFWNYDEGTNAAPTASALSLNGARVERSVVDGRFSDLIATSAPRSLGEDLAVPVREGILVLAPDRRVRGIYRLDGLLGLLPSQDAADRPWAVTSGGLRALTATAEPGESDCPGLGALAGEHPGTRLLTLERRGSIVQMRLLDNTQTALAWSLDCATGVLSRLVVQVDVAGRTRHIAAMQVQADATRFLMARADEAGHLALSDGRERVLTLDDAEAGPLLGLYGRDGGRTLLAVHQDDVFEIDTDAAITALSQISPRVTPVTPVDPPRPGSPPIGITTSRPPPQRPTAAPIPTPTPAPVRTNTAVTAPQATPPVPPPQPRAPVAEELVDWTRVPVAQRVAVQIALQRRGLYSGPADGIIGRGSRTGIRAYQRSINAPEQDSLTRSQFETLRAEGER